MIIFRALVFASFLIFPCVAWAEISLVQSGEHADFSRLVVDLPPDTSWSVEHDGAKVSLVLEGHKGGFGTARVFEFIPRTRIANIAGTDDTLTLTLTCDCNVSAFVHRDFYVVLDVAERDVALSAPIIENKTTKSQRAAPSLPDNEHLAGWDNTSRPSPRSERKAEVERSGPVLNEMQAQLANELGIATTRGLLDARMKLPLAHERQPHIDVGQLPVPPSGAPSASQEGPMPDVGSNMRISSSMDLPDGPTFSTASYSSTGQRCLASSALDPGKWASDAAFHKQIGTARQALFGEFDTLDPEAARQLAQLYLHFGFGAEAIQVLTIQQSEHPDNAVMVSIGEILEYGRPSSSDGLRRLLGCSDEASLWAFLAPETLDAETAPEIDAALRALNKLPVYLRQVVAPLLANQLQEYGEVESAERAIRSLSRLPGEMSTSAKLAKAQLAIEQGEAEEGNAQLDQVIRKNAPQSPEALIAIVEAKFNEGHPIDPETADLVAAYAKELQGSPIGAKMRHTHILALARSLQFDAAYAEMAGLGGVPEEEASKLRQFLLSDLTQNADDVVFLDHALRQSDGVIMLLNRQQKLALAERLMGLGFAGEAERVISSIPDRPRETRRQILSARIAMALQQPFKAKAELIGIEGETANLLRAKASEMAGAHEDAYELFRLASDPEDARRSAWMAGDWDSASLSSDPVLGPVAALSRSRPISRSGLDGLLTRSSAQLEESALARAALTALLDAPELQIEPLEAE